MGQKVRPTGFRTGIMTGWLSSWYASKQAIDLAMENGAKGVRIQLSGRLGGSEMARMESSMQGSIPLSTLRARIEYGFSEASTPQGNIGIKVWVNSGDYLIKEDPADLPPRVEGRGRGGPRRGRGGPKL